MNVNNLEDTEKMIKRVTHITLPLIIVLILIGTPAASRIRTVTADDGNLLLNGDFEGVFLAYPHGPSGWDYVAEHWSRWWIHGTSVPEYTDALWGRTPYEGERAQIYHAFPNYTAGIFQIIEDLTACRPYRLSAFTKTNAGAGTTAHSRIGLDPYGTNFTDDGAVKNGLPPETIWSTTQTSLGIWEELSVKAEPSGDRLAAIFYAAPRPNPFYETYWDTASLVPASYDNGRLPEPSVLSDFIYNVGVITGTERITITWHTTEPASASQVWYNVKTSSPSLTSTETMTHTSYLPLIQRDSEPYPFATGISFMRATEHHALINSLDPGQQVKFIITARRLNGDICETVRSEARVARTKP
jgi:hypothetical protein